MDEGKIKVLNILPVLGQPRIAKRITMLKAVGFDVSAVAFERDYHKGRLPDCEISLLGKMAHGKFLRRVLKILFVLPKLRSKIKHHTIIYAFGSDMAYMAVIASLGLRKKVVLEIGDIREIQVKKGFVGKTVRAIDTFFLKRCSLLVSTSHAFVQEYYRNFLGSNIKSLVLENKQEENYSVRPLKLEDNKITIGYFGLLRCEWSWGVLKRLALESPNKYRIVVAGYPIKPESIAFEAKDIENITYLGEYKSPDDLPSLYGRVNIVWACYPFPKPTEMNWKWARTNRYYESLCYKKPMISLENSGDSSYVEDYKIGLTIPLDSLENAILCLKNLSLENINQWTENVINLPEEYYIYTNERHNLKNSIIEILNQ
ncbi:hypothetical protein H7U19_08740 [Hyunsoonleella sp. SJ7]|uniref:Glycosyltransferase n=1 Tax=Hyunsoonleella aquatilis TaxID=2762758 RepID=A0A923HE20_9FLAO|nr:hypothetical protein [Hyunsoonleella aquatilis]MBC3758488.1 hypothetical protein [Hyunsoonleella aquatilis]